MHHSWAKRVCYHAGIKYTGRDPHGFGNTDDEEEITPLILAFGSRYASIGFAGDDLPREVLYLRLMSPDPHPIRPNVIPASIP